MIGFCIEASHARGLGHLFKALNLIEYLAAEDKQCIVMVNADSRAVEILKQKEVAYVTVNLNDTQSDWETEQINRFGINIWVNDRLDTDWNHALNVKKNGIALITFDDRGSGAALADTHFAPLVFSRKDRLQGKRVLTGIRYLVLSREIDRYRRQRNRIGSILVTLGGSDTYGVTILVVKLLKKFSRSGTVIVGPSFRHNAELEQIMDGNFQLKRGVPSLIREFAHHDVAVTGGGVTPFEANASGLPCIIVANELHEIEIGIYLEQLGSSVFAGYYENIDEKLFDIDFDIVSMSRQGIENIPTDGVRNIFDELRKYEDSRYPST